MTPSRCWVQSGPGDGDVTPPGPRSGTFPKQQAPNQNSLPSSYAWDIRGIYSRGRHPVNPFCSRRVETTAGRGPCLEQPQTLSGPHDPESRTRSPGHPRVLEALPCLLSLSLSSAAFWGPESPAQLPKSYQNGEYLSSPQDLHHSFPPPGQMVGQDRDPQGHAQTRAS